MGIILTSQKSSSNKRRIVVSEDEDDAPSTAPSKASTAPVFKASSSKLEPTSSMVRAEDQAAMEAMMGMDVDFDEDDTATKPATAKSNKGGKRTTRRVKKSKVEMDDKGYMSEFRYPGFAFEETQETG